MRAGLLCGAAFAAFLSGSVQASVVISSAPTSNMSCLGGMCQPTAKKAVLNATDLANMLATQEVTIQSGAGADTITVAQSFSWTSTHRLSLQAAFNVTFQAPITVAGPGSLIIQYATGGTGDLIFFPGASATFWDMSSVFTLQGQTYRLEPSLDQLSADIAAASDKGNFALANDFDATGQTYAKAPLDGSQTVALEGAGHTIANLVVHVPRTVQCSGLFDIIFGSVNDLNVTGADISTSGDNTNAGIISGCGNAAMAHVSTSGNVTVGTASFGGGLAGGDGATIRDSSSSANVTAPSSVRHSSYIGGLVGDSQGTIVNSGAGGTISGGDNTVAGGLVGINLGLVSLSRASGNVGVGNESHKREGAGGLAGVNYSSVSQSFATGHVSGGTGGYAGGLVGYGIGADNSYATGSAQCAGSCFVGGLGGGSLRDHGIGHSYSTASVGGGSGAAVGGFIGGFSRKAEMLDDYWDLDTSGVSDPSQGAGNEANVPGITGLSDAALKAGLPADFDPAIWGQKRKINHGYPYLLANPPQ
jgi:hypothetical protein